MKSLFAKVLTLTLVFAATLCGCSESPETYSFDSSDDSSFSVSSVSSEPEIVSEEDSSEASVEHVCDFGPWVILYEPTCVESGRQERSCACGSSETEEIEALGHQESSLGGRLPTCEEDGETASLVCDVCHVELEESTVIPKKGHAFQKNECVQCDKKILDISKLPQELRNAFSKELEEKYGVLFDQEDADSFLEAVKLQESIVEIYASKVRQAEKKVEEANERVARVLDPVTGMWIWVRNEEAVKIAESELKIAKGEYDLSVKDGETYLAYYLVANEDFMKRNVLYAISNEELCSTNEELMEYLKVYSELIKTRVESQYKLFYTDVLKEYANNWVTDIVAGIKEVTGIDISK